VTDTVTVVDFPTALGKFIGPAPSTPGKIVAVPTLESGGLLGLAVLLLFAARRRRGHA